MRHRLTLGSLTDRHRSLPAVLESDMDRQAQWKGWWMTLTRRGTHVKRLWMQMLWSLSWQYINKTSAAGFQPETFNTPKFSSATPERNERLISTSSCGSTQITSGTRYFFSWFRLPPQIVPPQRRRDSSVRHRNKICQYVAAWHSRETNLVSEKKPKAATQRLLKIQESVGNHPSRICQTHHRRAVPALGRSRCTDYHSAFWVNVLTCGQWCHLHCGHMGTNTQYLTQTTETQQLGTLCSPSAPVAETGCCRFWWEIYDNMGTMDLICTVHYKLR